METGNAVTCRSCGSSGTGRYCTMCGQPFQVKRISLEGLFHDAFHLFTHLDKGFALTLKMLIISPGRMQKEYIEGKRNTYQKPFSMFFVCLTIAAVCRYWIFKGVHNYYHSDNTHEANFFHEYMVLMQIALVPFHILVAWLFFYRSKYNYAEIGVLILYTFSFFLLASVIISLLKFIWPDFDTAYVELPILIIYNAITFVHFFKGMPRWSVIVKSVVLVIGLFMLIQIIEDMAMKMVA